MTAGRRRVRSSMKHQHHVSPGSADEMMGCLVVRKCAVACLFGDESQHPRWPQMRHVRRWTQRAPIFRQSSHPGAGRATERRVASDACSHGLDMSTSEPALMGSLHTRSRTLGPPRSPGPRRQRGVAMDRLAHGAASRDVRLMLTDIWIIVGRVRPRAPRGVSAGNTVMSNSVVAPALSSGTAPCACEQLND